MDPEIRLYQPRDREAVRGICLDTAYGGDEMGLVDPELFADLMLGAYTDHGSGALWVAHLDERVVGYLAGSWDERRFHRVQSRRVVPAAVARAVGRGLLLRRGLWRLLAGFPGFVAAGGLRAVPNEERYPGHLHLNLIAGARGRSVGTRLVERFLGQAQGIPGVRAVVYESNGPARRFFERLGFRAFGRSPAFKPPPREGGREWKILYGREL